MKQTVVVHICDNPSCKAEFVATKSNVIEGVTIPRVVAQTARSKSERRNLYACSPVCAGEAVQAALGVKVAAA